MYLFFVVFVSWAYLGAFNSLWVINHSHLSERFTSNNLFVQLNYPLIKHTGIIFVLINKWLSMLPYCGICDTSNKQQSSLYYKKQHVFYFYKDGDRVSDKCVVLKGKLTVNPQAFFHCFIFCQKQWCSVSPVSFIHR